MFGWLFRRHSDWRIHVSLRHGRVMRRWINDTWQYRELTADEQIELQEREVW